MAGMPRNRKKGISLAYVIVAAMVLLILSGVLASAAMRNMSLTAASTGERQAYLTVKSAVEYAKGEAYRKEKAGGLAGFSVAPGDPFRTVAAADPDGKEIYARCTVKDGLVTVSGRVAYGDSGRYRSLGCSFRLTEEEEPESGIGAVNCYVAAGQRYGNNPQFLNGDYSFSGNPSSLRFPVVFQQKISTSNQSFSAPEMYFLKSGESLLFKGGGTWQTSLTSDILYFGGPIRSESNSAAVTLHTYQGESRGIIWFDRGTVIRTPGRSVTIPDGAYYFTDGTNLLDSRLESKLSRIPDVYFETDEDLKELMRKVSYYRNNVDNIVSSEQNGGIGWTESGRIQQGNPVKVPDQDVFMYADKDVFYERWRNQNSPQTFEARSIVLHYNGEQDNPFTVPKTTITFLADTLWLNGQSEDGAPGDDSDDDDVLAVKQGSSASRFVLKSHGGGPVTVYLPHGLAMKNAAGAELYSVSAGTYSVESGTDLFAANADAFTELPSGGGGPGGGSGEGGVTVSELKYTDS